MVNNTNNNFIIIILSLLLVLFLEVAFIVYLDEKEQAAKMDGWTCSPDNICAPTDQIAKPVSYADVQKYLNEQRK